MSGNEYISLVGENLLKTFDNVYVIDIMKDVLFNYYLQDNVVKLKGQESFLNFLDKEKVLVSEEFIDSYTNILSGNFEDVVSLTFKKNDNYVTNEYCLIAKKVKNDNT